MNVNCYKCNAPLKLDIPIVNPNYKAIKAVCSCGHETIEITQLRDKNQQKMLNFLFLEAREKLK